jgi:hypothetical protein
MNIMQLKSHWRIQINRLFLLATLLVLALPGCGWAQFTFTINIDNGAVTITGYKGTDPNVIIPDSTNGYPVRAIGLNAFKGNTNVLSVTIPASVTNVEDFAFSQCSSLSSVALSSNLISLGAQAFYSCSGLTSVTIPGSVANIGSAAFGNCVFLSTAYFQGKAPTVNGLAGSADETVFYGNTRLGIESGVIYYPPGVSGWGTTFGSWPAICTTSTTPAAAFVYLTNNGAITITGYTSTNLDVIMPDTINGYPVTALADKAFFENAALRSFIVSTNVTSVGNSTFYGCWNLLSLTLPDGLASIGDRAFGSCWGLTSVTLPNSTTDIGSDVFWQCAGLLRISVAADNPNYASLGGVLFDHSLTTLIECPANYPGNYVVPNGVTNIATHAFWSWQAFRLASVTIPSSVLGIGSEAFYECGSLANITVDPNNPNYTSGGGVLFDKSLAILFQYPANALETNYLIPGSVTTIAAAAFMPCYNLISITVPGSVQNIGPEAFEYCYRLTNAYFLGNAPTVNGGPGSADSTVFYGDNGGTVYYLPGTSGWSSTFGGWPTAAWFRPQPLILVNSSDSGFGLPSNGFTISWATNTSVVVEASTNLQTWTPMLTNTLIAGTNTFNDPNWSDYPQRFYRVRTP